MRNSSSRDERHPACRIVCSRLKVAWAWATKTDAEAYRLALGKVEKAFELAPDSPMTTWTLGAAQYYVAEYDHAVETLRRADEMWLPVLKNGHPLAVSYLAMTLDRLGQRDQAQATFYRLQRILRDDPTWATVQFPPFRCHAPGSVERNESRSTFG